MNFFFTGVMILLFSGLGYFLYNKYIKKDPTEFIPNDEYRTTINTKKECDVILFSADWCPHCKEMDPEWINYSNHFNNDKYQVNFKKIMGDDEPTLVEKYKIESYPTIILVKDGLSYEYDSKFSDESMNLFIGTIMNN
jgi:thiol-disulfide isomerase/thioredoxin